MYGWMDGRLWIESIDNVMTLRKVKMLCTHTHERK